jgi:hypothetical protein
MRALHTGSPLFLRVLLDQLAQFGTFDSLDRQLRSLLAASTIQELYSFVLSNWETALTARAQSTSMINVMKLLWCTRFGISEQDLHEVSGIGSRAEWMRVLAIIRDSLVQTPNGTLVFGHLCLRSVCDWLG